MKGPKKLKEWGREVAGIGGAIIAMMNRLSSIVYRLSFMEGFSNILSDIYRKYIQKIFTENIYAGREFMSACVIMLESYKTNDNIKSMTVHDGICESQ